MKIGLILCGMGFIVLASLVAWSGPFGWSSVCDRCGAGRWTQEWQVPRTEIPLFALSTERDTLLSVTLRTNQLVGPHPHNWLFVHGGGNGVRCALGHGGALLQTASHPQMPQLVEALHRYHEWSFRDKVLTNILNYRTSWAASVAFDVPDECLTNAVCLHNWILYNSAEADKTISDLRDK